jgi:hypothetical protein
MVRKGASRKLSDAMQSVGTALRAAKNAILRLTPNVGTNIIPCRDRIRAHVVLQSPLLFRGIDLPEIVYAGVG